MSAESATPAAVEAAAAEHGLALRGGLHPLESDGVPALTSGRRVRTLLLLGNVGGSMWPAFAASAEFADGGADPLDRWSRRVVGDLARRFDAKPLFPFDGPPWLPFQRWAARAEPLNASPIGPYIHPRHGLWHAWRGALAFDRELELPAHEAGESPCLRCADRPCLHACPVDAMAPGEYRVADCVAHIDSPAGTACLQGGCLARRACPVGADSRYPEPQQAFHMRAFLRARRGG